MNKIYKSRILNILVVCFSGILVTGCGDDEPAIPAPVAGFTFTGTNDLRATTTVTFVNSSQNANAYSWDFGNGETSTETSPSVTYSAEGTYTVQLTAMGEGGTDRITQDIVVAAFNLVAADLDGVWSIIREEVTIPGSSTPLVRTRPMNWETLFYTVDAYQRLSMAWVQEELGSFSISNNVITHTPMDEEFSEARIEVLSFQDSTIVADIQMEDEDGNPINMKVTLKKNGPEYFGGPLPAPFIDVSDFMGNKWSTLEETIKVLAYSSSTDEYTDVVSLETEANITYNLNTIYPSGNTTLGALQVVDNWYDGVYETLNLFPMWTGNYWITTDDGGEYLAQIVNNLDGENIELVSVHFTEEEGEQVKIENRIKLYKNDGSEATVTESDMTGSWEVMSKTETEDGVDVAPGASSTPPIGFVLTFNADGSADLGDVNPGSWFLLDECNFVVVSPAGDESLVHVVDFESVTGEMDVFSVTSESESDYRLTLSLEKQ